MRILTLFFLLALPLGAQSLPGWTLVWSDEFAQANGSAPDSSKWSYDLGGGGWGNSELQYYTNSTNNARIESGKLIIEVREESVAGYGYTSARLKTQGKFEQTYGRFEARIKVPSGQGLWPAFWTLGNDIGTVGWPDCGEIDIMEFVGRLPNEIFGTIHGPGYSGGESFGSIHNFGQPVADDYHTYVVEWEPNEIRWYVDEIHYHTANPSDVAPNDFPFDHPFFMILNVAVGGNFGGPVGDGVVFPKQMLVDYVRVYEETAPIVLNPEQLENNGLELNSLNSWTAYSPPGGANEPGVYIESSSDTYWNGGNGGGDPVQTHSGNYVAKVFGDFNGNENFNGFYQDRPAAPGSRWTANGWALSHPQDLMSGDAESWIEVSFRNSAGNVIDLYRSQTLKGGSFPPNQWIDLHVTDQYDPNSFALIGSVPEMIAPAGTTTVRYEIVFRQILWDGGSMYFDDLSLVQLSEIVEGLLKISGDSSQVTLDFETTIGSQYQIFTSPDLTEGSWAFVESIPGTGSTVTRSYAISDDYRFYRLHIAPP